MKIVFRFLMLALVVVVAANYYIYQKTGSIPARTWLANAQKILIKAQPETVKVSKWTDDKGIVHYENRLIEGAKTIEVDPSTNVLPPSPIVKLPDAKEDKPKSMNEEVRDLQEAKDAYYESVINN